MAFSQSSSISSDWGVGISEEGKYLEVYRGETSFRVTRIHHASNLSFVFVTDRNETIALPTTSLRKSKCRNLVKAYAEGPAPLSRNWIAFQEFLVFLMLNLDRLRELPTSVARAENSLFAEESSLITIEGAPEVNVNVLPSKRPIISARAEAPPAKLQKNLGNSPGSHEYALCTPTTIPRLVVAPPAPVEANMDRASNHPDLHTLGESADVLPQPRVLESWHSMQIQAIQKLQPPNEEYSPSVTSKQSTSPSSQIDLSYKPKSSPQKNKKSNTKKIKKSSFRPIEKSKQKVVHNPAQVKKAIKALETKAKAIVAEGSRYSDVEKVTIIRDLWRTPGLIETIPQSSSLAFTKELRWKIIAKVLYSGRAEKTITKKMMEDQYRLLKSCNIPERFWEKIRPWLSDKRAKGSGHMGLETLKLIDWTVDHDELEKLVDSYRETVSINDFRTELRNLRVKKKLLKTTYLMYLESNFKYQLDEILVENGITPIVNGKTLVPLINRVTSFDDIMEEQYASVLKHTTDLSYWWDDEYKKKVDSILKDIISSFSDPRKE